VKKALLAYVLVVAAIASAMYHCNRALPLRGEYEAMTWSEIKDNISVPAKPTGTWTLAYDYLKGPVLIRVEASGKWSYAAGKQCGPDGDLNALIGAAGTILPEAPLGALIVKIGGSSAGANDGTLKVVGSVGIVEVGKSLSGPVFLTINDELKGMADNEGAITAKLSIARAEDQEAPDVGS
jgi:hypothetical protein